MFSLQSIVIKYCILILCQGSVVYYDKCLMLNNSICKNEFLHSISGPVKTYAPIY